jgi:hypothetical protein
MVRPHRGDRPSAERRQNGVVSLTGIINDLAAVEPRIDFAITDIIAGIARDRIGPGATYNYVVACPAPQVVSPGPPRITSLPVPPLGVLSSWRPLGEEVITACASLWPCSPMIMRNSWSLPGPGGPAP